MDKVHSTPEHNNNVKQAKIKNQMKKQHIPQEIIDSAKANNQRIIVNENGIEFEDIGQPLNWSNIICYSIIILAVLGLIFQLSRI
jgi:hypothetical protein